MSFLAQCLFQSAHWHPQSRHGCSSLARLSEDQGSSQSFTQRCHSRFHSGAFRQRRRARTVGLDPEASAVVWHWISKRKELGLKASQPLFCTLKGDPIDTSYYRHLFKRLAAKAGLDKRVHPHGLRHSGAVHLLDEGKDVVVISRQLGHSNLGTTNTYLNHLKPADVIEAMKDRAGWSEKPERSDTPINPEKLTELTNEQLGSMFRQFLLANPEMLGKQ